MMNDPAKAQLLTFPLHLTYREWILDSRRDLIAVIEDIEPLKPIPVELFINWLPRLKCRYYSISSSSLKCPEVLSITVALVDYTTYTELSL
ncbi:unnamed protein product [Protopolystoma xenopodis]|uniref:Sulfite reductase [NADPH] flavoprotein alpha-component-like FAD-binding domain-containing protein n=1 Tax=Protopolystoma xenopodis TaxID=117903 RepID=A0A3S5BP23_9PLAT|nr:unnamed protein product [Protopolystoma xenopodis]